MTKWPHCPAVGTHIEDSAKYWKYKNESFQLWPDTERIESIQEIKTNEKNVKRKERKSETTTMTTNENTLWEDEWCRKIRHKWRYSIEPFLRVFCSFLFCACVCYSSTSMAAWNGVLTLCFHSMNAIEQKNVEKREVGARWREREREKKSKSKSHFNIYLKYDSFHVRTHSTSFSSFFLFLVHSFPLCLCVCIHWFRLHICLFSLRWIGKNRTNCFFIAIHTQTRRAP